MVSTDVLTCGCKDVLYLRAATSKAAPTGCLPTNNISERKIRPSVVFRKVTGGFRSNWGAGIHAAYRFITGTAQRHDQLALGVIRDLVDGNFVVS